MLSPTHLIRQVANRRIIRCQRSFGYLQPEQKRLLNPGDDKDDFTGKAALQNQKKEGLGKRLVTLQVETVDADAFMNESIYKAGRLVGRITSGATSHVVGNCLSMAYLEIEQAKPGTTLEVQVLENRCPATVIADSPYDPDNGRPRA